MLMCLQLHAHSVVKLQIVSCRKVSIRIKMAILVRETFSVFIRLFILLGQLWSGLKRRYWLMCQGGSGGTRTVCPSEWQRQGNLSRSTEAVLFPAMVGMMMMMMMTEKLQYFMINICVVSGESEDEEGDNGENDYWWQRMVNLVHVNNFVEDSLTKAGEFVKWWSMFGWWGWSYFLDTPPLLH